MRLAPLAALLAWYAAAQTRENEGAASAGDGDNLNFSVSEAHLSHALG